MGSYLLFFSHFPQILWYALIARELKARLGLKTVIWVIGERDQSVARGTDSFDIVVNLLDGLSPTKAEEDYLLNLKYLSALEEKCSGVFYHQAVAIDRHLTVRRWSSKMVAHYAVHCLKAMECQLDSLGELPLAAFGENNTLPYRIAHCLFGNKIPYWNFTVVRHWDDRFYLDDGQSEQWAKCRELYREYRENGVPEPLRGLARKRLKKLRERRLGPFYSYRIGRGVESIWRKLGWQQIRRVFCEWCEIFRAQERAINPRLTSLWQGSPIWRGGNLITRVFRKNYFDLVAQKSLPNDIGLASYFLHVQPEHSVEGLAFEFRDQAALIQNIAASLPADTLLVVKEHKPMVGLRPIGFYQELLRTPNIMLLSDAFSSYDLIRKSRLVFSLTGTAALEAMYEGIPAIIFGSIFFEDFEGIYKVDSIRELKAKISDVIADRTSGASEEAAVAALAAMYAASYPGKIGGAYSIDEMRQPDNVRLLADAVEHELLARPSRSDGQ